MKTKNEMRFVWINGHRVNDDPRKARRLARQRLNSGDFNDGERESKILADMYKDIARNCFKFVWKQVRHEHDGYVRMGLVNESV